MSKDNISEDIYSYVKHLQTQMHKVILGKSSFINYLLTGFLTGGHILIEDVPGLGKTTAAKALSKIFINTTASRIQCTPDLLPYDIIGTEFYDTKTNQLLFQKGPIFADIVLIDELNRASSRTQSALLEAMAESQVTVNNKHYPLSSLFFVIATQNPVDLDDSYTIPISELDRFLFKLSVGYPSVEDEKILLQITDQKAYLNQLEGSISIHTAMLLKQAATKIYCSDTLMQLIVHISHQCRSHPKILLGPSPRASIHMLKAVKALALLNYRSFVIDEDIKEILSITLTHRIKTKELDESDLKEILIDIYNKSWIKGMSK